MKTCRSGLNKYNQYFEGYEHNIPVIFSTLDGQYPGTVYSDDDEEIVVLVTGFDFLFVGGNIECKRAEEILHDIIFNELVLRQQRKEIIVFGGNGEWNSVLSNVFQRYHGISDLRKCYHLNRDKFTDISCESASDRISVVVTKEQENDSTMEYPVARVYVNDINVSFCSAFMLARGHAEIDVATEEAFRQKGYAKAAAIALIKELINCSIEPDWCTWPYRTESQALAVSIGFELDKEVPAYIWVEDFGL